MAEPSTTRSSIESWDDLRFFLAVARTGKLAAAAEELGVNHSTVFRRIGHLEEALGARLFERHRTGYTLTAAGDEMLIIAERIEDDVLAIDRLVLGADRELEGVVRFTTVDEIHRLIAPQLARFRDAYPGIVLEVEIDQRLLSLTRREADVAIRPGGERHEPDVVGRALCDLASAVYAAPAYLDGKQRPRAPRDLAGHDLIGFDDSRAHTGIARWIDEHAPGSAIVFRANTMVAQQDAARAGLGIALLPCFVGDADRGLERLFVVDEPWTYKLWMLLHADLRQTARVRAFVDFIADALTAERDLFEGARGA